MSVTHPQYRFGNAVCVWQPSLMMNWDFDIRIGLHKRYLRQPGDTVRILGYAEAPDTLGYDQIISVNDGSPQYVDGTPYAGKISRERTPPEAHEVARAIKAREAFLFNPDAAANVRSAYCAQLG